MSVFERSETDEFARGARALVIYPELPGRASVGPEARLAEAEGLALAIGLNVVQKKGISADGHATMEEFRGS